MIVYREDAGRAADPRVELAACAARAGACARSGRPTHDAVTGLLIDLGVIEAAIADAIFPGADGISPLATALRRASLAAGRLFRLSWREERGAALQAQAQAVADELEGVARREILPPSVCLKLPEGYAYYALYPETYLAAAERFVSELRPERVVGLGIRSIGTSLSAVVMAACEAAGCEALSLTLRPRGHPFARRAVVAPALAAMLRDRPGAWFLIIDEGPGLSGSSFGGTAALLTTLGIDDERIVLFPSHLPEPGSLRSAEARKRWARHRKAHVTFEQGWLPHAPFPATSRELSGGAWRGALGLPARSWPAVQPQHERRKYLAEGREGLPVLHRFAGLGCQGERIRMRAEALAEAGFSPPVHGLSRGFLAQGFMPGRPLSRHGMDRNLLRFAGAYLHFIKSNFSSGIAHPELLLEMIRVNVMEGLGAAWGDRLIGLERQARSLGEAPAVALDGRVLPHEWLRTEHGHLKIDATDHHADHFFPGPTDLAWDVAGFGIEFDLPAGALQDLAMSVGGPTLPRRLPFYRLAYLAFRLGYTVLAAETLSGSPDGARMARLAERYRKALRRVLAAW